MSLMADKNAKSNNLATVLVAVLMFSAMGGFFYFKYLWKPFSLRKEKAVKKIEQIDADIAKALVISKRIDQLNAEIAQLRVREKDAENRLPRGKQLPNLVRGITAMARDCGVTVSRIVPQQTNKMPFYSQSVYALNGSGTFYGVYRFIAELAVSERIYTIESLRIGAGSGGIVTVSFNLMAYEYGN